MRWKSCFPQWGRLQMRMEADLKYVLEVARTVGRYMNKYILVVTKSTVPVGTAQKVKASY